MLKQSKFIALLALATSFAMSAHAARQCSVVTRPDGSTVTACKNVPENPPPTTAAPSPAPAPTPKPAPKPVQPAPAPEQAAPAIDAPNTDNLAQFSALRKEAFEGIAQAAAIVPMFPTREGNTMINMGAASYGGQSAIGLSIAYRATQRLVLTGGFSAGTSGARLVRIGAGFEF